MCAHRPDVLSCHPYDVPYYPPYVLDGHLHDPVGARSILDLFPVAMVDRRARSKWPAPKLSSHLFDDAKKVELPNQADAGVAATALLWQLSQRPDTWQSIARHVHSVLQPSKPKNRRAPKRRGTHTPEDDMAELVHALGWDKWLNSLTSPQQHKKRWNPTPTRWKKERY